MEEEFFYVENGYWRKLPHYQDKVTWGFVTEGLQWEGYAKSRTVDCVTVSDLYGMGNFYGIGGFSE